MSILAYSKLRVLENRHPSRVYGPKGEEVIGGCTAWSSLIFIFCHMQGYFLERFVPIVKPLTQNIWMITPSSQALKIRTASGTDNPACHILYIKYTHVAGAYGSQVG
jgi:hypothetical protein